jgi:dihydrofolate synthase / folylpolyglutamate synthase
LFAGCIFDSFNTIMTYQETIDYLYAQLPMFSRIGAAAYKKDLTNTLSLCKELGNPQHQFKSIHIAGTNGKGSVSHMLAAILQQAGYKTGLHTSPHLKDYRERIRINGEMIPEASVIDFVERINKKMLEIKPSFFEISVAMAFDYFASQKVDIAIIETGLGGRLDSTNVIIPELSVITNIGWDHMNLLGDSLEKIAAEKAGIIKEKIPVVIGESQPEIFPIFKNFATEKNADFSEAALQRLVTDWHWEHHYLHVSVATKHSPDHIQYKLDLPGIYQLKNLLTVLESVSVLQKNGWNISEEHIHQALQQVKKLTGLHGRWELIHQHPDIILEVAHNENGVTQIMEHLELCTYAHLHIVLGMVKDKEVEKILTQLPKHARYYFTNADIPRAMQSDELKEKASIFELSGDRFENVNEALVNAKNHAKKDDLILVCGSIFLIAEVDQSNL